MFTMMSLALHSWNMAGLAILYQLGRLNAP